MKIVPKLQNGAPVWYNNRYGNRTYLQGWKGLRLDYANANLTLNGHYNAGSLDEAFRRNLAYTNTPAAIGSDILTFYNTNGSNMSAEDYEKFYNSNAEKIRSHWAVDRVYGTPNQNTQYHNRLFRSMFASRSNLDNNSDYNIGYQEGKTKGGYDMDAVEGSSTWLRRMDLYENENENDPNRIHTITLGNGKTARYYKMANGNIKLMPEPSPNNPPSAPIQPIENPTKKEEGRIIPEDVQDRTNFLEKLRLTLNRVGPDILSATRLAGNLYNNLRVYDAVRAGIRPNLQLSYNTYRQIVGDEATKLAYYNRGADLITRASRPFTSDADRLRAYMMEAYRQANELRALGDLADNQRIRETSAEAAAHADGNKLRWTEAANYNIMLQNQAKAAKLLLLALKYASDWTDIDTYLLEKESRWRTDLAENKSILNLIKLLQAEQMLSEDNDVKNARAAVSAALEANNNNAYAPDVLAASEALKRAQLKARINVFKKLYPNMDIIDYAKEGAKLVNRKSERLLYRTAKDIIDHFRRMSKMTDDSRIRSKDKPLKLSLHPMKKMQQGGIAPFTKYRPAPVGLESAGTAIGGGSASVGSSKSSGGKDETLEFIKKLFSDIKGLPIDVLSVYDSVQGVLNRAQAFGEELSTSLLATMYLNSMRQLNNIAYSLKVYDDARQLAIKNDAMGEYAVTADGRYMVQNIENPDEPVKAVSFDEYAKNLQKYNLLTNGALLSMRPYSANMALLSGNNLMNMAVSNAIGMSKIGDEIKKLAGTLGSSEREIEGLTKAESGKVKAGLLLLANDAPDGVYKINLYEKNLRGLIEAALNYILRMLPTNYRAVLQMHAAQNGVSIPLMIAYSLGAGSSDSVKTHITPLSGSASANGGTKGSSDNSAGLAFVLGQGPRELVTLNTGTSYLITALGTRGVLQDHSNKNLGLGATLLEASSTQQGGYFQWNKATFGGSRINPSAFSHVILNDGSIVGVDLPYTIGLDGNEVPDFLLLRRMEEADLEIRQKNILPNDYLLINQIYLVHSLPPKYDLNGKLTLQNYKRFAIIQATLDENALLNKEAILSDEVALANDTERDLYNESMRKVTGDKKFELDDGFLWWGGTKLYKGSVFVPYTEDVAFAAVSSGKPFDSSLPNNASTVLQMLYAPATLNYKPQDVTLSLILNN